jgi:phenylacetate-CoA ligase
VQQSSAFRAPFWRYPRSFWVYARQLRRSQYLPAAELEARQLARLRALLRDAARHVPYYRDLFRRLGATPDDFRSLADLRRLPVLSKQQVRDNPYQFLHDHTHPRRLIEDHTSGSTGQPLEFYLTAEQKAWDMACAIRFWHWIGYRTGARIAAFRHYQPPTPTASPWKYERHSNTLFFSVYDMTPDNLRRYAAEFNRFRPQYVRGYPSSIFALAQFAASEGLTLHPPHAVLTSSETLAPEMRAVIERTLQCPVYDWWGSNERLVTACQCEQRGPYHVNAEAGILELVPEDGCSGASVKRRSFSDAEHPAAHEPSPRDAVLRKAAATPEAGLHRLIATGLINHAMPLIRYDLGDYAVPAAAPCACGRGLPSLARILGRTNDLIITGEGKRIPSVRFYTIFETHTAIRQFQVEQTAPDAVQVRLVVPRPLAPAEFDRLRVELTRFLGERVRLEFAFVDVISPEPSGKLRNVISLVRS